MKTAASNALIILTRNPELGKCKTRLAATIGDQAALNIYTFLLSHTASITATVKADKFVFYSEKIHFNDNWDETIFQKKVQKGEDLGARMHHAFEEVFSMGYSKVIIIGSDMYDISTADLDEAFDCLEEANYTIGPALDGGYYLLGMRKPTPKLFQDKEWGTNTVLEATRNDLSQETLKVLTKKNDIDYEEDLKGFSVFDQFLK